MECIGDPHQEARAIPTTLDSALQLAVLEYFAGETSRNACMIAGSMVLPAAVLGLLFTSRTAFARAFMRTVMIFAGLMIDSSLFVSIIQRKRITPFYRIGPK